MAALMVLRAPLHRPEKTLTSDTYLPWAKLNTETARLRGCCVSTGGNCSSERRVAESETRVNASGQ